MTRYKVELLPFSDAEPSSPARALHIVEDGVDRYAGGDGGEPEAATLSRDWRWVPIELEKAYALGREHGKAEAVAAAEPSITALAKLSVEHRRYALEAFCPVCTQLECGCNRYDATTLEVVAIRLALRHAGDVLANAAKLLGLGRATLYRRLRNDPRLADIARARHIAHRRKGVR